MAGFDHERALQIAARWPLLEVLAAYHDHVRREALSAYRHSMSVWASLAPWRKEKSQAPQVPEILKDE